MDRNSLDCIPLTNPRAFVCRYTSVVSALMERCRSFKVARGAAVAVQHPVLGWVSESLDRDMRDAVVGVAAQLQELWSPSQVARFFKPVLDAAAAAAADQQQQPQASQSSSPTKGGSGGGGGGSSPRKQSTVSRLLSSSIFSRSARKAAADPVKIAEARHMAAVSNMCVINTSRFFFVCVCAHVLSMAVFVGTLAPSRIARKPV
jgi:hypothetical protein